MSLASGGLRRVLRLERRQAGVDAVGQPIGGWEAVTTLRGDPRSPTGMAVIKAGLPADVQPSSWRVRYHPTGIDAGMRLVHVVNGIDGDIYDVQSVRHDHARQQWTDIICQLGGNDG